MAPDKEIMLLGGLCLFLSAVCLFRSKQLETRALGPHADSMHAGTGHYGVGGEERKKRLSDVKYADYWFWLGLTLSLFGVVLQTIGSL